MADIVMLNDRWNALNDKIETMEREHGALEALAITPAEERRARRLDLRIQLLWIDREELRERMDAAMVAYRQQEG